MSVASEAVCRQAGVAPSPLVPGSKVGLAMSTLGDAPINGLRHNPTDSTSGWYLWCGTELSEDPNFFSPLHVEHLVSYLPEVLAYLELPPGHRFLIAPPSHRDVWFDARLLQVK